MAEGKPSGSPVSHTPTDLDGVVRTATGSRLLWSGHHETPIPHILHLLCDCQPKAKSELSRRPSLAARGVHLAITERRSRKRYPLRLPLAVRPAGVLPAGAIPTQCRDVSSHGVYFFLEQSISIGSTLELTLTLPSEITQGEPVRVRCEAQVKRTEPIEEGRVGIAAKIERYRFLPGKRRKAG